MTLCLVVVLLQLLNSACVEYAWCYGTTCHATLDAICILSISVEECLLVPVAYVEAVRLFEVERLPITAEEPYGAPVGVVISI